jgi:hypothetical protein
MAAFNRENRENSQEAKSGEKGGWGTTVVLFSVNNFLLKRKSVAARYRDATVSSFVAKVAAESHNSVRKRLFSMPERIL